MRVEYKEQEAEPAYMFDMYIAVGTLDCPLKYKIDGSGWYGCPANSDGCTTGDYYDQQYLDTLQ